MLCATLTNISRMQIKEMKKAQKETEEEWKEKEGDLKERLNEAIQSGWNMKEVTTTVSFSLVLVGFFLLLFGFRFL